MAFDYNESSLRRASRRMLSRRFCRIEASLCWDRVAGYSNETSLRCEISLQRLRRNFAVFSSASASVCRANLRARYARSHRRADDGTISNL